MKKLFVRMMTVLLTLTIVGAPVAVSADARISFGTATANGGGGFSVQPVTLDPNMIPFMGVSANLQGNDLVQALKAKINAQSIVCMNGMYDTAYDRGRCTTWVFNNCNWHGFAGKATMTYYVPTWWDPVWATSEPYYVFNYIPDPDGPSVMCYGGLLNGSQAFYFTMYFLLWRNTEMDHVADDTWEWTGRNGEYVQIWADDDAFTFTFVHASDRQ